MKHDPVNNPKHYDLFPNEQSIDIIQSRMSLDEFKGFLKGNCLKYRLRQAIKAIYSKTLTKLTGIKRSCGQWIKNGLSRMIG